MLNLDEVDLACPCCQNYVTVTLDCSLDEQKTQTNCGWCHTPINVHLHTDDQGVGAIDLFKV